MLKVNYKVFSKHAEKVAKGVSGARPVLKGINHDEHGTLTVTDSHRLYRAYNVNAPKNVILDAVTGEEMDNVGTYPDVDRLIPDAMDAVATFKAHDVSELLKTLKAMQAAGMVDGTKRKDVMAAIIGDKLTLESEIIAMTYQLKSDDNVNGIDALINTTFLIDAIDMLNDMKAQGVRVHYYGDVKPVLITPDNDDKTIDIIVLPIRRHNAIKRAS